MEKKRLAQLNKLHMKKCFLKFNSVWLPAAEIMLGCVGLGWVVGVVGG